MKLGHIIASATLMVFSFSTYAASNSDKKSAIERYHEATQNSIGSCKLSLILAQMNAQMGSPDDEKSDYEKCIKDGKTSAKADLKLALKTLKNAAAKDALKSYHVAFVSALEGITPSAGELKVSYDARQNMLSAKVNEAWTRFELEE